MMSNLKSCESLTKRVPDIFFEASGRCATIFESKITITRLNQVWRVTLYAFGCHEVFVCLMAVIDRYMRYVIAWE